MPRTHALDALVPTFVAVGLAWLGTAHALHADASGIDGRIYLLVAFATSALIVLACMRCWHIGAVAGIGAVSGLWWGSTEYVERVGPGYGWLQGFEYVERVGPGYGWLQGFEYVVFVVPLGVAVVALSAVIATVATGTCPPSGHRAALIGLE